MMDQSMHILNVINSDPNIKATRLAELFELSKQQVISKINYLKKIGYMFYGTPDTGYVLLSKRAIKARSDKFI